MINAPNRGGKYPAVGASASGVYTAALVAILVAYFLALYYFRITGTIKYNDFGDFYTWVYAARIGLNPYAPGALIPLAKRLGVHAMTAN